MPHPRVTTVMGVARVVLSTVPAVTAAEVLVDEFGFDATFQGLALLPGEEARAAFGQVWTSLVTSPLAADLTSAPTSHGDPVLDASHGGTVVDASHGGTVVDASHGGTVVDASHGDDDRVHG